MWGPCASRNEVLGPGEILYEYIALPVSEQVADFGGGEVAIFSGGKTGVVCRLMLAVPLAPGAGPQDIQVRAHQDAPQQPQLHPEVATGTHGSRVT